MHKVVAPLCKECKTNPSLIGYYLKFGLCSTCYRQAHPVVQTQSERLAIVTERFEMVSQWHLFVATSPEHSSQELFVIDIFDGTMADLKSRYKPYWSEIEILRFSKVPKSDAIVGLRNLLLEYKTPNSWYHAPKSDLLIKFDEYLKSVFGTSEEHFVVDLVNLNTSVLNGADHYEILIGLERLLRSGESWLGSLETPKK